MKYLFWGIVCSVYFVWCPAVWAGTLAERVAAFPNWNAKPSIERATVDLAYPDWIAGTWHVKSTGVLTN